MRTKMNDGDKVNDDDDHDDIISLLPFCKIKNQECLSIYLHFLKLSQTLETASAIFSHPSTVLAAWLIKQHHCNAWPENQPWKLKYKLKTDLTHVLSVISPSRWQKISKCTWFSMVERSPTAATCAATQPPVLPNWKDTCSGSQKPILLGCEISWSTK